MQKVTPPPVTIVAHDVGGVGGMERQLEKLIHGMLAAGSKVTVISRTCRLPRRAGLRWVRVLGPSRPFSIAFPWFYVAGTMITAVRRCGLVHSTGALVGNRVDVTTVHFCHLGVRRRVGRYTRRGRATVAYAVNAWIARTLSEATERWSYQPRRVREIVAVSHGVAWELRECFPHVSDRVRMIPNGVDLDVFRPDAAWRAAKRAELGLGTDDLAAIFIGGDWRRKGLAHAIEAVGRRRRWHLIVAGAGDIQHHRARAEAAGTASRVHFIGVVDDVNRYLAASDAFVLPTAYEAAPLVGYEAASSGVPMLTTRVNGLEDLIDEDENGWFIERNADSIGARLAALEADPELRARMGCAARDAAKRFDWGSVVALYCDLYERLSRPAA